MRHARLTQINNLLTSHAGAMCKPLWLAAHPPHPGMSAPEGREGRPRAAAERQAWWATRNPQARWALPWRPGKGMHIRCTQHVCRTCSCRGLSGIR